jgi:hypothetical protein
VETAAQNSLTTWVNAAIGRHVPARARAAREERLLRQVLEQAGFADVEVFVQS